MDPIINNVIEWHKLFAQKTTRSGEWKEVTRLEIKWISPKKIRTYVAPKIAKFVMHNPMAKWQDTTYKISFLKLKDGEIIFSIDFVKNYSFKEQNKV